MMPAQVDQAFAESDEVVEADFVFGRHTGVTLEPRVGRRRLERSRSKADDLSGHAGAAYGAEHRRASSGPAGIAGARGLQGCRRLLRHQGPYLCRRDGDLCVVETAAAADQIRRRPGRKLQYRHSCPRPSLQGQIGVKRDGTITAFEIDDLTGIGPYSMYPRTSAIEANQVVNLVGGPYVDEELSRARPRRVPEQECHVPIPCRRPSDRVLGDRRPCRSGGHEDRHGPGRNPPPQSDCR